MQTLLGGRICHEFNIDIVVLLSYWLDGYGLRLRWLIRFGIEHFLVDIEHLPYIISLVHGLHISGLHSFNLGWLFGLELDG